MIDLIRLKNVTNEMIHFAEAGHEAKALQCHDQVRNLLMPTASKVRPEDDPNRSAMDRADWTVAR